MPFEKKGKEPLDARLNVRLPERELGEIQIDADEAGISVSEVVRARYFGRRIVANADLIAVKELRRVAGLLKKIHVDSGGAYSEKTAAALSDVHKCIIEIDKK